MSYPAALAKILSDGAQQPVPQPPGLNLPPPKLPPPDPANPSDWPSIPQNAAVQGLGLRPGQPPPGSLPAANAGALFHAPAEHAHRAKQDKFVREAIVDFHKGGLTRQQLADALADQDAYDYAHWKRENVVHPSRAVAHGVAAEEPTPPPPSQPNPPPQGP